MTNDEDEKSGANLAKRIRKPYFTGLSPISNAFTPDAAPDLAAGIAFFVLPPIVYVPHTNPCVAAWEGEEIRLHLALCKYARAGGIGIHPFSEHQKLSYFRNI